ncbi:beta-ketoacyl synthase N-terminal-like domain-containing protein [Streptomyces sp. NPDC000410]|uniref:type I polyketide synthase n=1 Tax=Streptomyces sp. NPDC000410 TaxID=3154254 RepID=UPI00331D7FAD
MAELRQGPRPTDAAIVGMGAVFPGAADLSAYRRNLFAGTDAIGDVPADRWDPEVYYDPRGANGPARSDRFYCRRGGFVDDLASFDPTRFGIMPTAVTGAEPDQLLALHATAEAVADAGGEGRLPSDRSRIGVVLGRGGFMGVATARLDQRVRTAHQLTATLREIAPELGEARITAVREAFQAALGPEQPEASIGLVPSFTAARTANRLDFRGPAYTLDAACASSLLAVDQAAGLLAAGRCDVVVAGAVHHCHIATLWSVFTQLRALSPSERIRPFDRRADGTLLSEGTGVVLLKRLCDAERDGDRVYAVVRGVGVGGDGRAASLMSPLVDGQVQALERAWRDAGLDPTAPDALGLLEAHGTGTPVGDTAELATLARVFGPPSATSEPIALGSVKSMLGHTMQASGMAGLIKAALAVHAGVLPPTLHLDDPHADFPRTRMRPVTAAEPWERGPRRAGVNAFGFGGINAHAILEEAPGATRAARRAAPPVRRFVPLPPLPQPARGDAVRGAFTAGARPGPGAPGRAPASGDVLLLAADSPEELARRLQDSDTTRVDGPCRLAVVGPTPERLTLAAKVVARGRAWRGRGDVWFTPRPLLGAHAAEPGGRLALLFPGLEPEFAASVDDVADHLGLDRPALSGGDELIERALDAIAIGRFFARALPDIGIRPDLLAGHSLGEWAAMVVAGMYPQEAVDAFLGSLRPGSLTVPDLVYAAVGCGARQAAGALHGLDRVVVSHDNCPHQSVVCGEPEQVATALGRLKAEGVLAQELPFRSGFHTPMWEPYLDQVRGAFDRLPLQEPTLPVWSATTGSPYPTDTDGLRRLVLRHLLEPVDFRTLTLRLYENGVRAFVSAGPGSLTGFVTDTLRADDHLAVAAATPTHTGLDALRRTAAALWAEGLEPHWDRLARPAPRLGRAAPGPAAPATALNGHAHPEPAGSTGPARDGAVADERRHRPSPGPEPWAGTGTGTGTEVGVGVGVAADTGTGTEAEARDDVKLRTRHEAKTKPDNGTETAAGSGMRAGADARTTNQAETTPQAGTGTRTGTGTGTGIETSADAGGRTETTPQAGTDAGTRATVMALDLGSPLVRLGAAAHGLGAAAHRLGAAGHEVPPSAAAGPGGAAGPRSALLSALDSVLAETEAAARAVTDAWSETPGPVAYTRTRRLSLDTMPYVSDHCVYLQPEHWPEPADRFPVVPMTTMLELAAEAAVAAWPGHVVTGFDDMRALRWLPVAPPVDVEVTARPAGEGRVRVTIGDCATVTVALARRHPSAPGPDTSGLTAEGPAPVSAEALYRDRWMFHGPGFAGVHEVTAVAEDGIRGVLRALPAPGALLDAAGQLLGHWMQLRLPVDRLVFPASLERIRLYGPAPRDGTLLAATARIRDVREASVRGDVELRTPDGAVWARLDGWTYRRFAADERVWPMKFTPEVCGIGEPQPGGWCVARRRWSDPASQELVMRRYLGAAERAAYERLTARARPAWLLGRIAAKDALRQALWDRGAGPLFPAEVPVGNDEHGRPVPGGPASGLHLSLAHKDLVAVAVAHPTAPVGIDVETVTNDPDALVRVALTADELRLAESLAARDGTGGPARALTTLWCAKEAAAKAEGGGLGGRPRQWTVTADPDDPAGGGLRVTSPEGRGHLVRTSTVLAPPRPNTPPRAHVVAYTYTPADTPADTSAHPSRPSHPSQPTETRHGI